MNKEKLRTTLSTTKEEAEKIKKYANEEGRSLADYIKRKALKL